MWLLKRETWTDICRMSLNQIDLLNLALDAWDEPRTKGKA